MPVPKVEARPAATVMLARDVVAGVEVLMVTRRSRGFFGGLTVFPGGAVDPIDRTRPAAIRAGEDHLDLEYRVAALRELAEETGLAITSHGVFPAPAERGEALLLALDADGTRLDAGLLTLVSRWVTPEEAPTRFDTRFYLTTVGETPEVRLDRDELVAHMWLAPDQALAMEASGELEMFLPTVAHLRWLSRWTEVAEAVAAAHGVDGRSLVRPKRMGDGSLVPVLLPGDE